MNQVAFQMTLAPAIGSPIVLRPLGIKEQKQGNLIWSTEQAVNTAKWVYSEKLEALAR